MFYYFRQLSETVDWVFSEPMIIYYIQQFTLSMWPDGKLSEPEQSRSDEEKLRTRMEAKEKFLQNMPGNYTLKECCLQDIPLINHIEMWTNHTLMLLLHANFLRGMKFTN